MDEDFSTNIRTEYHIFGDEDDEWEYKVTFDLAKAKQYFHDGYTVIEHRIVLHSLEWTNTKIDTDYRWHFKID